MPYVYFHQRTGYDRLCDLWTACLGLRRGFESEEWNQRQETKDLIGSSLNTKWTAFARASCSPGSLVLFLEVSKRFAFESFFFSFLCCKDTLSYCDSIQSV